MEPKNRLKIIVADDDKDDLDYFKFLFEKHPSFDVVKFVDSAFEIIQTIEKEQVPEVLLTDFYMPLMTGSELTQYLLERNLAAQTHIFIISSVINEAEKARFSENPLIHFLLKPANLIDMNSIPGIILEKVGLDDPGRV